MRKIKRVLATVLSLVLVFDMCKVSEVCAFQNGEEEWYEGLAVARAERRDEQIYFETNLQEYYPGREADISRTEEISVASISDKQIQAVTYDKDIEVRKGNQSVGEEIAKVEKGFYRWDDEQRKDVLDSSKAGIFTVTFAETGTYKIFFDLNDDEFFDKDYEMIEITVVLPEIGLYRGDEAKESDLLAIPDIPYRYTGGEKAYLVYKDQGLIDWMKNDFEQGNLLSAWIDFGPEFKRESIDLIESEFAPVEITIPEYWAGDYYDSIIVCKDYVDDYSPEGIRHEERRFNFKGESEGLVLSDATWDNGNLVATSPQDCPDWYGKDIGAGLMDINHKCLAIKDGDNYTLLGMEDLNKLTILDEDGNFVGDDVFAVQQGRYRMWDDEIHQDVEVLVPNVFECVFKKCGTYTIRYQNGNYVSKAKVFVNMPDVSVYAKKCAEERYCLGKSVGYNNSRNTLYIMLRNDGDEWHATERSLARITSCGDFALNQATVSVDYESGIITVKFAEDSNENFGIRVDFTRDEIDYDGQGNETNRWVEYDSRDIWFNYTDNELSYEESVTADIEAVEAFEAMVSDIPEAEYVTVADSGYINSVNKAFEELTEEQLRIVEIAVVEKLDAVNTALGALLDDVEVELQKKTEADKVVAKINELMANGAITLESAEAVAAARAAYDALTDDQKAYVSKEAYVKLVNAEGIIKQLDLEAQVEKVKAENTKLTADNKKLLEEKGSEKVSKPATVKVSDVLTDTVSKAKYKVLSVGKDNAMGTVEFVAPLSNGNTKFTVPSTITSKGVTYAVVAIANNAFKDNKKLKKVVISEGIKTIGAECFSGCKKLKKIIVNTTVLKKVGKNALKGVAKKCVISVPSNKFKKYKKVFKKKGQGKKVKVKKS